MVLRKGNFAFCVLFKDLVFCTRRSWKKCKYCIFGIIYRFLHSYTTAKKKCGRIMLWCCHHSSSTWRIFLSTQWSLVL